MEAFGKKLSALIAGSMIFSMTAVHAEPMDISVIDGDVRAVLLSAARMGGFNVVMDDSVDGKVTLSLQGVEPEDAMRLVAGAGNLILERIGDSYVVTSRGKTDSLSMVHVFPVRYGNPEELRESLILSFAGEGKSARISNSNNAGETSSENADEGMSINRVTVDPSTNSLVFYGTPEEAIQAGKLINTLDVPARQVSLEAKVVALDKSAAKELGVEWTWSPLPMYPKRKETYRTRRQTVTDADGTTHTEYVDVPTVEVERNPLKDAAEGIIQFGRGPEGFPFEFYYGAKINAMIMDGKAKMLSRPIITTIQGHEAIINIGGEVPVPTVSTTNSTTTTSIEYRQAGIILRYTPRVNADGFITAKVHTEVSSPLYVDALKAYRFQKRSADTTVRLKDGETMVIGGLIGSEESRSLSKVPFLGDLPILGAFFRNVKTSKTDSELMIFLTARVLD